MDEKIFVVHRHDASNLHWDFRIQRGGMLMSFAVPKEPPREKGIKRLAIEVEDHPLSYAKFEGEIKEGYGKGRVDIWDQGRYQMLEERPNKMTMNMKGFKMKGIYVLVKYDKAGPQNWLLLKK